MFEAVGRFVYRRRRLVLLAWAVLFTVGIVVGGRVFSNLKDSNGGSSSSSVQGAKILDKASGTGPSMMVVVSGQPVDDPATRAAVERATTAVAAVPGVVGSSMPTPRPILGCAPRTATPA
jgi:putative drug exporter of the RND superfamily